MADALAKVLRSFLADQTSLPYVCIFALSADFELAPDLSLSHYPGLISCHIVRDAGTPGRLITYWQGIEHCRAHGDTFRRAAGLPEPYWMGTLVDLRVKKAQLWKRFSWKAAILTAAALFGAFAAFRDYFSVLFSAPQVAVAFSDLSPLDSVEDSQISVPLTVLNELRFAPTRIIPRSAAAHSSGAAKTVQFDFDVPMIPALSPGQSAQLRVFGTAPKHTSPRGPPDVYQLSVLVAAEAGMLRGTMEFSSVPARELRVWWEGIGWSPIRAGNCSARCDLDTVMYAGSEYPHGVRGHVILTSTAADKITDLDIAAPVLADTEPRKLSSPPGETVMKKVEFQTQPLDKFREYRFRVLLEAAKPLDQGHWARLAKKIELHAQ
jgi:hypothetical protein